MNHERISFIGGEKEFKHMHEIQEIHFRKITAKKEKEDEKEEWKKGEQN